MNSPSIHAHLEHRLFQAADAAGSSLACRYGGSAEWHAEAVKAWRDRHPKPTSFGFHLCCIACLAVLLVLV
jgi:hypothetical protein